MSESTNAPRRVSGERLGAAGQRGAAERIRAALSHTVDWMYWNGGGYRLSQLPRLGGLHTYYRRHRRYKKFGISDPILVLQNGKVGSTAIFSGLRKLDLDVPVYHVHNLNRIQEQREKWERAPWDKAQAFKNLAHAEKIRAIVVNNPRQRWSLITPVRAPVERVLSSYFELLEPTFPNLDAEYAQGAVTLEQLHARFVAAYCQGGIPRDWFQEQIHEVFGIDVYATPFDQTRHYQIYANARARLLVLRLEDFDTAMRPAMQEFLGLDDFRLPRANVSDDKGYANTYRDFKQLRFPRWWVMEITSSRWARQFYTEAELEASRAFWADS